MIHYEAGSQQDTIIMTTASYLINHRALNNFEPLTPNKGDNRLYDLHYLGLLRVEGEQAREFLQGQLSSNMLEVNEQTMRPALRLNLKGRIMDILYVFQDDGVLYLLLPLDMLSQTREALMKTAVFSKVSISEYQGAQVFGYQLNAPTASVLSAGLHGLNKYEQFKSAQGLGFSLGHALFLLIATPDQAAQLNAAYPLQCALSWQQLALACKIVSLYPESRGLFLPHRLDFHQDFFIDLNKGCYKGQEIVARTHYKATLKHELKLFVLTTVEAIFSGQKVFNPENKQEIAELIDYAPLATGQILAALSILKGFESAVVQIEQQQQRSQIAPFIKD